MSNEKEIVRDVYELVNLMFGPSYDLRLLDGDRELIASGKLEKMSLNIYSPKMEPNFKKIEKQIIGTNRLDSEIERDDLIEEAEETEISYNRGEISEDKFHQSFDYITNKIGTYNDFQKNLKYLVGNSDKNVHYSEAARKLIDRSKTIKTASGRKKLIKNRDELDNMNNSIIRIYEQHKNNLKNQ